MKLAAIVADARKGLTAFVGAAGEVLALGLLHGSAERWTTSAVGIATAVLVYLVPNGKKSAAPIPPSHSATLGNAQNLGETPVSGPAAPPAPPTPPAA